MFRTPRTWFLAPPIDREAATRPSYGLGNISSLIGEEKFGPHSADEAKDEALYRHTVAVRPTEFRSLLDEADEIGRQSRTHRRRCNHSGDQSGRQWGQNFWRLGKNPSL